MSHHDLYCKHCGEYHARDKECKMNDHYEGKGCKCAAKSAAECGCSKADWTDPEIYKLRSQEKVLQAKLNEAKELLKEAHGWAWGSMDYMTRVGEFLEKLKQIEEFLNDGK